MNGFDKKVELKLSGIKCLQKQKVVVFFYKLFYQLFFIFKMFNLDHKILKERLQFCMKNDDILVLFLIKRRCPGLLARLEIFDAYPTIKNSWILETVAMFMKIEYRKLPFFLLCVNEGGPMNKFNNDYKSENCLRYR